jgi:AraC-like DNA-binding protein
MEIIFSNAGFVTAVFFGIIILLTKKHYSKYILLSFIVALIIPLLPLVLKQFQMYPPSWLNVSFSLLWGPALYLYINSLLKKEINSKAYIIHALPFIIFYITATLLNNTILPAPPNTPLPPQGPINPYIGYIFPVIQNCSLLAYSLATLQVLNKHYKTIKNYYSYENVYLTIRWSYIIVISFASSYILLALLQIFLPRHYQFIPFSLQNIIISIFIYFLAYLGNQQKPVYLNLRIEKKPGGKTKEEPAEKPKYLKNRLSDELREKYQTQLLHYLENEKPYLQNKLSIEDVSNALDIPKHFISQIINDGLNRTFYSFINSYRVAEVKSRIAKDKDEKYTLLSIAFDAGFNSKSGFNKNFKIETGMTPHEYRKRVNNS